VSTERYDANEDVRVDSGWALLVSGVLSASGAKLDTSEGYRPCMQRINFGIFLYTLSIG
jgi:hypothetical protein